MSHAVVVGASVAGLLAAAALRERFERVTVLDRDPLPEQDGHRKGTGQGRHAHGLLARGREAMEELLPGLTEELVGRGATPVDIQERARWINEGRQLARGPSGLGGLLLSRPLLEGQVRRRVAALGNVTLRPETVATGLVDGGVLVDGREVHADLVVDATGRGSRLPAWLEARGYEPPVEERVAIDFRYTTREFHRTADDLGGDLFVILAPTEERPRGGVALAMEGDRWIVTLGGYHGGAAPTDLDGFIAYAASLPAPDVHELVAKADPIGDARTYRVPASVRRRYERLARFPEGLVAVGDAVCAFNPIYGQGMTVAATEALALRGWDGDARAYFRTIARLIDGPWDIVVGGDLRLPGTIGRRTPKIRLVNAYLKRFHAAAREDPALGRAFLRVANLLDPPHTLLLPRTLARVLRRR